MTRGQGDSERPEQGAGRFERWRAGWRVALRMARRDVRRHRGRSILITVMVGLPVLLLVAGSTLWYAEDLNTAERLPLQLGQSQGYLSGPDAQQFQQLLDPNSRAGGPDDKPRPAQPVPGYGPGHEATALGALVGGRVHPVTSMHGTARVDGHVSRVAVLGVDGAAASPVLAPHATLDSGRWPIRPNEVLVTPLGAAAGLPLSGTFELTRQSVDGDAVPTTVTVVGTGQGFNSWGPQSVAPVEVITTPSLTAADMVQWLVERNSPITWPEIEQLNRYGVGVYSRYVALHPETVTVPVGNGPASDTSALYAVGAATLGLLLLTSLLAGPAFAVSAARQRRTLALAASNGATRPQLRRSVLAQALVLGILSSLLGAVIGVAAAVAVARIVGALKPAHFFGPLEVPWPAVAIVVTAGVVSSVIAAVVPARGLGKLDIVSILRGQSVSPRLRRRVPLVGAALAGVGEAAVLFASFQYENTYFFVFLGGVLLIVVGALFMVPLVLALGARLAQRLPLAPRMAAREAGRLRGRATPTVAAIMAGAAVLATACIALQADTVRQARSYQPVTVSGQGVLSAYSDTRTTQEVFDAVHRAEPAVRLLSIHGLYPRDDKSHSMAALRPGCSPSEVVTDSDGSAVMGRPYSDSDPLPRCATLSSSGSEPGTALLAADLDELTAVADLTPQQRTALADGAVAVLDPVVASTLAPQTRWHSSPTAIEAMRPVDLDLVDGKATFFRYVVKQNDGEPPTVDLGGGNDRVSLPVVHLDHEQWVRLVNGGYSGGPGGIITIQTAHALGLAEAAYYTILRGDGPITAEQEGRLTDAVATISPDATLQVERGFQRSDALIIAIVIAVISLVILVATLIATALGQAEAAPLLGTLAAVGATRGTRRAMAAAQAAYLALLGALLGLAVGIAPGIAISRIITANYTDSGIDLSTVVIDIPWLQILLPVLLVPLVAATLAWVSIRRAPMVTRRAT